VPILTIEHPGLKLALERGCNKSRWGAPRNGNYKPKEIPAKKPVRPQIGVPPAPKNPLTGIDARSFARLILYRGRGASLRRSERVPFQRALFGRAIMICDIQVTARILPSGLFLRWRKKLSLDLDAGSKFLAQIEAALCGL
jgi:hypothetical protein